MAQRVQELPEIRKGGYNARYPWSTWTDGSAWKIEKGVDFDVPAKSMQAQLYIRAERDDLYVTTRMDGNFIWFQFFVHKGMKAKQLA